jgi:hypothetical protein
VIGTGQARPPQMTTMLVSAGVALAGAGALSALLLF